LRLSGLWFNIRGGRPNVAINLLGEFATARAKNAGRRFDEAFVARTGRNAIRALLR
jgi:hypothetical protein